MPRHRPVRAACLLLALAAPFVAAQDAPRPPNFLVVVADDCTWSDLGAYGGQASTPNLDSLCVDGLRFERCFQSAPMCSPTRHALYTGLHPVRTGAYPNHTFAKEGTRSVVHHLRALGYRVALSGKRHVQPEAVFPFEYSSRRAQRSIEPDDDAMDRLLAECAESRTPFCLFACSNEPHSPWNRGDPGAYPPDRVELPPHYVDTPATRDAFSRYLAEITFFDAQVGRYLALLDRHGFRDSTCVIVVSEQGNAFPFAKWTCYEAGLRSAMIVRWPGVVAPGTTTAAMVEYVDVVPTIVEAAGGEPIGGFDVLDGRSFLRVLRGEATEHKAHVFGLQTTRGIIRGPEYFGIRAVRSERYRYVVNLTPGATFWNHATYEPTGWWGEWVAAAEAGDARALRSVDRFRHRPAEELYDVVADPWCLENLAGREDLADVQADLRVRLERWMAEQGDAGQVTELRALERQWRNR